MTQDNNNDVDPDARAFLKALSPQDFLAFGMNELAYVAPLQVTHFGVTRTAYALRSADGGTLMVADHPHLALAAARQHDMEAMILH